MKRFFDSLIFKIGVVIIILEAMILFATGVYYIHRFSREIDKRITTQIQIPGILMTKGLLNYESVRDKKIMEQLVGETLIDVLLISINQKVFYSLNPDYTGRRITEIPEISFLDRLDENRTEPEKIRTSEGQNNYLVSIFPIRREEDGKTVGFLYIKAGTNHLEQEKKILTMLFIAGSLFCVVFTTLATLVLFNVLISGRLQDILVCLKTVEEGHLEARIDPILSQDEIGRLQRGVNSMIAEIEERTRALQESEDRYRGLVESSPEAIFVEQNGSLVYINPTGLRLLGYGYISELNGYGLQNLLTNAPTKNLFQEVPTPPLLEGKLVRRDRKLVDVEVAFIRTTYQGKPAIQSVARDVTEIKDLREKAQRMKRLADLGQLSATIAHEIRNPLASISLGFEKLSDHIPEAYENLFRNINLGISRIQSITQGILDFTRLAPPDLKKVNLHDVLDSSLHSVQSELEQAGIIILKDYASIHPYVLVDAHQMIQVFVNLFLNAKQDMGPGGKLTIRTAHQDSFVEVYIEDTGKGIPPENLEKIFTPFFTTRTDGMGLGLAVVSRILEQHQSQILVESQVGRDTQFTIRLPYSGGDHEKSSS